MCVATEIVLSKDKSTQLNKLSKSRSVSVRLADAGMTNEEIGIELGVSRQKEARALCAAWLPERLECHTKAYPRYHCDRNLRRPWENTISP